MKNFNLDMSLVSFGTEQDAAQWTLRNAVEGVQIFGGIGSGKTSGSGRTLALKFLQNGFGGLVLTAKRDEKQLWEDYCRISGRSEDLIVLEPGGAHTFDFIKYLSRNDGLSAPLTGNILDTLKTVIRAGEDKSGSKSDDPFWETALDMLIHQSIDLCLFAYGRVSIEALYEIVQSIPRPNDKTSSLNAQSTSAFNRAYNRAKEIIDKKVDTWFATLSEIDKKPFQDDYVYENAVLENVATARDFKHLEQYFSETFKNLSEKTRSIVELSFSGFLFKLLKEPVYSIFCRSKNDILPEASLQGKIILINLPVKIYQKIGRNCQILFKYIWQMEMEKRDILQNERPVFLWADEAQNFLHEHDTDFQATARASRVATVYLSQNINNYFASMAGDKYEFKVKSFLGTLGTKIFHANADVDTNRYSSELIGDEYFIESSVGSSVGDSFSKSKTDSMQLSRLIRPEEFATLKTGGPLNNHKVQAIIHRQGDGIFYGSNFLKTKFDQQYKI